jgi:hypothetical protein
MGFTEVGLIALIILSWAALNFTTIQLLNHMRNRAVNDPKSVSLPAGFRSCILICSTAYYLVHRIYPQPWWIQLIVFGLCLAVIFVCKLYYKW